MDIWEDWDHPLLSSDLPPGTLHLSGSPPRSGCHKRALLRKAWRTWRRRSSQVPFFFGGGVGTRGRPCFCFFKGHLILSVAFYFNLFHRCLCLQNSLLYSFYNYFRGNQESIRPLCPLCYMQVYNFPNWQSQPFLVMKTIPAIPITTQNACFIPSYSYLSMWFCISNNFQGPCFLLGCPPRINLFCWIFSWRASLGLAPGERPKTSEVVLTCWLFCVWLYTSL